MRSHVSASELRVICVIIIIIIIHASKVIVSIVRSRFAKSETISLRATCARNVRVQPFREKEFEKKRTTVCDCVRCFVSEHEKYVTFIINDENATSRAKCAYFQTEIYIPEIVFVRFQNNF